MSFVSSFGASRFVSYTFYNVQDPQSDDLFRVSLNPIRPIIVAAVTGLISLFSGNCIAEIWECVDSYGNKNFQNYDPHKPTYSCPSKDDSQKRYTSLNPEAGCIYVPPSIGSRGEVTCKSLNLPPLPNAKPFEETRQPSQRQNQSKSSATAPQPKPERRTSSGTGFYVSADGYLITNAHVINSCQTINAVDGTAKRTPLRIIRILQSDDLALLKANTSPKSFAVFRESSRVNQGEVVVAYGYPLAGLLASGGNVSTGIVTALAGVRDDTRQIQISAPVQPGNSGGPLVDARGLVIGVVVSKLDAIAVAKVTADIPQNINFAIKSSSVVNLLDASSVQYRIETLQRDLSVEALSIQMKLYTVKIVCE